MYGGRTSLADPWLAIELKFLIYIYTILITSVVVFFSLSHDVCWQSWSNFAVVYFLTLSLVLDVLHLPMSTIEESRRLTTKKHKAFFRRCLTLLPQAFIPYDSSHVSLVYFCLGGLDLLGELSSIEQQERENIINWTYLHLVANGGGFRGSMTHNLETDSPYDAPNLAATYFCLCILAMLRASDIFSRINRSKILAFVKNCQKETGEFSACYHKALGPFGECDTRQVYLACAINRLLTGNRIAPSFNVAGVVNSIENSICYDGGLSDTPHSESHGGLSYCGIAALSLVDKLPSSEKMISWLVRRQIDNNEDPEIWSKDENGGRNGRVNKPADTCYSFWTGASLEIFGRLHECSNVDNERLFLLEKCQHDLMGGFVKSKGAPPDPLHSYLGLAACSLLGVPGLQKLNAPLCLTQSALDFIDSQSLLQ